MREGSWRRAAEEDLPALELFLRVHEAEAVGFVSRLIDFESRLGRYRLRLPRSPRSSLWIYSCLEGPRIVRGAALCTSTGLAFPLFPEEGLGSDAELAALLAARRFEAASIVGPAREVERLERALSLKAIVAVDYRLMYFWSSLV